MTDYALQLLAVAIQADYALKMQDTAGVEYQIESFSIVGTDGQTGTITVTLRQVV